MKIIEEQVEKHVWEKKINPLIYFLTIMKMNLFLSLHRKNIHTILRDEEFLTAKNYIHTLHI